MNQFRAFVVHQAEDGLHAAVAERSVNDLPQGEVTIRVAYSSVNYKDGLAASPRGNVAKQYPLVPGIDLAGTVLHSSDPRYAAGDEVLATGYGLGVSHDGGFSEVARVPADWIVPLPQGLSMKDAMAYGTAGFTAALSIQRLEENGLTPDGGPVLVTGATGGVGSMAVAMLAKSGYEVAACTGKASEHQYLRKLGAQEIIDRSDLVPEKIRALDAQRWAGAVDPVGGRGLAYILSTVKYGGSVAVSGLTGGTEWNATVFPFILRGVNLLGIDSVYCPMEKRLNLWERMAGELKPDHLLSDIGRETSLDELPAILNDILQGKVRGRTIVKL